MFWDRTTEKVVSLLKSTCCVTFYNFLLFFFSFLFLYCMFSKVRTVAMKAWHCFFSGHLIGQFYKVWTTIDMNEESFVAIVLFQMFLCFECPIWITDCFSRCYGLIFPSGELIVGSCRCFLGFLLFSALGKVFKMLHVLEFGFNSDRGYFQWTLAYPLPPRRMVKSS